MYRIYTQVWWMASAHLWLNVCDEHVIEGYTN